MFALDDIPWSEAVMPSGDMEMVLDGLCTRLETARARGEPVWAHDSIYELPRLAERTLTNILFESPDLSREVTRRAQIAFDRLTTFGDEAVAELEIAYAGKTYLAPTVSWAHAQLRDGNSTACMTATCSGRSGQTQVLCKGQTRDVPFVASESDHVAFFRSLCESAHCGEQEFADLAAHAFPNVAFVDGVFRGLRDLSQPLTERRAVLVRMLAALSDASRQIFASPRELEVTRRLAGLGFDASTETRETLEDLQCRRAREREFLGNTLLFDWHFKIEAHVDRIHFHPPIESSGNRPIVGIIHRHLPLPSDR